MMWYDLNGYDIIYNLNSSSFTASVGARGAADASKNVYRPPSKMNYICQ